LVNDISISLAYAFNLSMHSHSSSAFKGCSFQPHHPTIRGSSIHDHLL
jgi:hypothetical protein